MLTSKFPPGCTNPFLTEEADVPWERLDKQGKPVSKEELLQRARALKKKGK